MLDTLTTLRSLRSIHGQFSEREVSEQDLSTIVDAATRAANASARQSYSIIVLDDRERMDLLLGYRASRALIFCVDFHRLGALAGHLGRQFSNDDAIGFVTGLVDTSLAAQTAVIAARALEIDSLVTNGLHRRPLDLVYRELALPETSVFPLIAVLLGYPREEPARRKGRLPLEHVVHRGAYHRPDAAALDRMVAAYDDPTRGIGLVESWQPEFEHYLDWFFEKWTGKPSPDRVPRGKVKELQDRLVASGFWWPDR